MPPNQLPLDFIFPDGIGLDSTVHIEPQNGLLIPTDRFSNLQVVVAGKIVQIREFSSPVRINGGKRESTGKTIKKDRSQEYKERSINKKKNDILLLANANFGEDASFLTLTQRDGLDFDTTNLEESKSYFRNFIRKLLRRYTFEYIAVAERQKRGVFHWHVLNNLPFVPKDDLALLWGAGFVDIRKVHNRMHIAGYLTKYLTKELVPGERRVITSRNLIRPETYYCEEAEKIKGKIESLGIHPGYTSEYDSDYNGLVHFSEFDLSALKKET
jgi:hypothetical protein